MINKCMMGLVLIVGGCFLFERPYTPVDRIHVSTMGSYRSYESDIVFQQDVKAVKNITDRVATKYEFVDYTDRSSDVYIKYYGKKFENGGGTILVYYDSKMDLLEISILADRHTLNSELVKIAEELGQELQAIFGKDRVKSEESGRNEQD